jgi:hypothetical protein
MIIEITDIPAGQKLSRITVDFDNGNPSTSIQLSNNKNSSYDDSPIEIDYGFADAKSQVSQDIVEKPVIPDKEREIKVSPSMQNLSI